MSQLSCGCTPDASGFGYCGECTQKLRRKIWAEMSEKQKNFDRHVAPLESEVLDAESQAYEGCSCHINPPCSYCVSKNEEEMK